MLNNKHWSVSTTFCELKVHTSQKVRISVSAQDGVPIMYFWYSSLMGDNIEGADDAADPNVG